jgi:hypothetical protein
MRSAGASIKVARIGRREPHRHNPSSERPVEPFLRNLDGPLKSPEVREFAVQQARSTLTSLYALIGDRWLSHPDDVERVTGFHDGNLRSGRGTAVKSLWVRTQISYDGGHRFPLTARWPGNLDPGQAETIRPGLPLSAAMADLLASGIPEPPARTG